MPPTLFAAPPGTTTRTPETSRMKRLAPSAPGAYGGKCGMWMLWAVVSWAVTGLWRESLGAMNCSRVVSYNIVVAKPDEEFSAQRAGRLWWEVPVFDWEIPCLVGERSIGTSCWRRVRAGSLAPHEASHLPRPRSGRRRGAPRLQIGRVGTWGGALMEVWRPFEPVAYASSVAV